MEIVKKCSKIFFEDILSGRKKFEVRIADFVCKEGDILVLKEVDEKRNFTGRELRKKVNYVLRTNELKFFDRKDIDKYGYQIISFD